MLQVIIIWAFISFFQLIWYSIKHSMKMSGTSPCMLTVRKVQVVDNPRDKKNDLCKVALDGYYEATPISTTIEENIQKGDTPRFTEGQSYQVRYNPRDGKIYDPVPGKEKIKSNAIILAVSIVAIVILSMILSFI